MPELKSIYSLNLEQSKDDGEQIRFEHFDMSEDGKYLAVRKTARSRPIIYDLDRGVSPIALADFHIPRAKIIEPLITANWVSLVIRLHEALTVFFEAILPGGKILFRPKVTEEPDIAYVFKNGGGISIYQFSDNTYRKTAHLQYRDKSECRRGATGWSPNGEYFVSGSYAGQGGPGERRLSVWSVADQRLIYRPLFDHLKEDSKVTWSSCSKYFVIDSPRELFLFDIVNKSQHDLKGVRNNEKVSSVESASWHPSKPFLALACEKRLVVIDADSKSTVHSCNDIKERTIEIAQDIKSYYSEKGVEMNFERHACSDVAFSSCGNYLASSDYWGNIVIRSASDFGIVRTYNVHCNPGGSPSRVYWMTNSPNGVLIIVTVDKNKTGRNVFYASVTSNELPHFIETTAMEDSVFVRYDRVAIMNRDTINVYEYS